MNKRVEPEQIVRTRVYQEWEAFIAEYDKQTILDICDKIHFYDCVVIFFLENGCRFPLQKRTYNFSNVADLFEA